MEAVILAGGKGERLRPITCALPKPLVSFMGKTVLDGCLQLLSRHGISKVYVTSMFMANSIEQHLQGCAVLPAEAVQEEAPLGTAGAVKHCEDKLSSTFVVLSGDCVTDCNLTEAIEYHKSRHALATLVLFCSSEPCKYGTVSLNDDGSVQSFLEKPQWSKVNSGYINGGIYILEKQVLDLIPAGKEYDFAKDVFTQMLRRNMPVYGYISNGYWCDIGDKDKYMEAHTACLAGACPCYGASFVAGSAVIDERAQIAKQVYIGENCVISGNSKISAGSVIGANCVIKDSEIINSVIWHDVTVDSAVISGSVVCNNTTIMHQAQVQSAVLGAFVTVGRFGTVRPGCRIWPGCCIDDETVADDDICTTHSELSRLSVSKLRSGRLDAALMHNIIRAGLHIGALYNTVYIGYEGNDALAQLLAAACALGGGRVLLANEAMPQARFGMRFCGADIGAFISQEDTVSVILLDKYGCEITGIEADKINRAVNGSDVPVKQGSVYNVSIEHEYNSCVASCYGKSVKCFVALAGKTEGAQGALQGCGVTAFTSKDVAGGVKANGCAFGLHIAHNGAVDALFDENGVFDYEQFIYMRCLLCAEAGARFCVLPFDTSQRLREVLEKDYAVITVDGSNMEDIAREYALRGCELAMQTVTDAGMFAVMLLRRIADMGKQAALQRCAGLPQRYESTVRCPNCRKGEVMQSVNKNTNRNVRVVPDDNLAQLKVCATAATGEFAKELVMDMSAQIEEILKHGQS